MSSPDLSNLPIPSAVNDIVSNAKGQAIDPTILTANKTVQDTLQPVQDLLQNDTFEQAVKTLTTILETGTGPESPVVLPHLKNPPEEKGKPVPSPPNTATLPGQTSYVAGQLGVSPQSNPETLLKQGEDILAQPQAAVTLGVPDGRDPSTPAAPIAVQKTSFGR